MAHLEVKHQRFHSKYSLTSIIKNGGWKFLGMSGLTVFAILLFNDFHVSFSSANYTHLLLLMGIIGPLITGTLLGVKEIKIENDRVFYKTVFPTKWKSFSFIEIHHVCYFQKPIERYAIFPKAVFFRSEAERLALLEFLIPKKDIYQMLSLVYDKGKPVLFYNEFKSIEETKHYATSE